jgi:hypothetical protein
MEFLLFLFYHLFVFLHVAFIRCLMKKLYLFSFSFFFLIFHFLLPIIGTAKCAHCCSSEKKTYRNLSIERNLFCSSLVLKERRTVHNKHHHHHHPFSSPLYSSFTLKLQVNKGDILYDDDDNDVIT